MEIDLIDLIKHKGISVYCVLSEKCWVIMCKLYLCYYISHITFCRPIIMCLLNRITETIQVNEGRKYFPRGPHFGQP